jgi:hypothetical protein
VKTSSYGVYNVYAGRLASKTSDYRLKPPGIRSAEIQPKGRRIDEEAGSKPPSTGPADPIQQSYNEYYGKSADLGYLSVPNECAEQ